jgi:hypothetical protein
MASRGNRRSVQPDKQELTEGHRGIYHYIKQLFKFKLFKLRDQSNSKISTKNIYLKLQIKII